MISKFGLIKAVVGKIEPFIKANKAIIEFKNNKLKKNDKKEVKNIGKNNK